MCGESPLEQELRTHLKLTSVMFDISLLCQQAKNNDSKQKNKLEIVQESLKKPHFSFILVQFPAVSVQWMW